MKKVIIVFVALLLLFCTSANADDVQYRQNIARRVKYFGYDGSRFESFLDNDNTTLCYLNMERAENYIGFINKTDKPISEVYINWASMPKDYIIQKSIDGNYYEDLYHVNTRHLSNLLHVDIKPKEYFRIFIEETQTERFSISSIEVYDNTDMPLPPHVEDWTETVDDADLMIFSAHADDEWVFFGGAIPLYSVEKEKDTIVVYMAADKFYRKSEALAALWAGGLKTYPIFAHFKDKRHYHLDETMDMWGEHDTIKYCVKLIRKYKPEVILTHDFEGEYGHGNHRMTAYAVDMAVILANDKTYDEKSAEKYGVWDVSKLYIHLYKENPIVIDYTKPLRKFDGLTAYEVSKKAIRMNYSQMAYTGLVHVHEEEEYCCANWGLRYTSVGLDKKGGDFFENVVDKPIETPTPMPTMTPAPTPCPTPTNTICPTATLLAEDEPCNDQEVDKNYLSIVAMSIVLTVLLLMVVYLRVKMSK